MARFINPSSYVGRDFYFKINPDGSITPPPPPPSGISLLGTRTYDATGLGSFKSISDIEQYSSQLPGNGYLRYTIRRNSILGGDKTITVPFYKHNDGKLCQSAFSLTDTNQFLSNVTSIFNYGNDDHDTLAMRANGTGFISVYNSGNWANGNNYSIFRGATELANYAGFPGQFGTTVESFVSNTTAHFISFPQSGAEVWIRFNDLAMLMDGFSTEYDSIFSYLGNNSPANSLWSISDGVNSALIGRWNSSTTVYVEFDLTTGKVYKSDLISYSSGYQYNSTEEDANGTAMFAVNAKNAFHANGNFHYETLDSSYSVGWRFAGGMTANGMQSIFMGNSTQTDMDVFGSIDSSGNVWFADWGHDDGGLFGYGNDNTLGVAKTKIRLSGPSDIDGESPKLVVFNESLYPDNSITGGWYTYITGGYGSPVFSIGSNGIGLQAPLWQDAVASTNNSIDLTGAKSITIKISSNINYPYYYYASVQWPTTTGYVGYQIANPSNYSFTNREITIPITDGALGQFRLAVTNSDSGTLTLHSVVVNY
jgi:hypothetical protein